jgi:hypothetical protein
MLQLDALRIEPAGGAAFLGALEGLPPLNAGRQNRHKRHEVGVDRRQSPLGRYILAKLLTLDAAGAGRRRIGVVGGAAAMSPVLFDFTRDSLTRRARASMSQAGVLTPTAANEGVPRKQGGRQQSEQGVHGNPTGF